MSETTLMSAPIPLTKRVLTLLTKLTTNLGTLGKVTPYVLTGEVEFKVSFGETVFLFWAVFATCWGLLSGAIMLAAIRRADAEAARGWMVSFVASSLVSGFCFWILSGVSDPWLELLIAASLWAGVSGGMLIWRVYQGAGRSVWWWGAFFVGSCLIAAFCFWRLL